MSWRGGAESWQTVQRSPAMSVATKSEIPEYLRADPIAPEMIWEIGSLGSPVLALRGGRPDVLERIADGYAERFRKSWRDLRRGIAVFMAPTKTHEFTSIRADGLAQALCLASGLAVVALGAATIRTNDAARRRGDPDESFFIGEKAERCLAMERAGLSDDEIGEAFEDTPADLAVEVEHTNYERAKRDIYRRAGVRELWEMATALAGGETAIIDLQAPDGPRPVAVSNLIPGVRADGLDGALRVLREIGGYGDFREAWGRGEPVAERLLGAASEVL